MTANCRKVLPIQLNGTPHNKTTQIYGKVTPKLKADAIKFLNSKTALNPKRKKESNFKQLNFYMKSMSQP